jgi:trigger factor
LKIETQRQEDCTLNLTVEVEEERVRPALQAAARRLAKRYPIAGFRPGKAPYETILRHFGEAAIYEAAIEDLGQKVYEEVLEQEKIEPYAPGQLADMQLKPMVLKFTIPLRPEVTLGDYRALRVPYAPPGIADAAVEEALERLRQHHAIIEPVDREAAMGDVTILDVNAFINEGENPSDFLLADKDVGALLEEDAEWPVHGFPAQVVGIRAGESRKFDLPFPEDYPNSSLRGQLGHFEVICKEVKSRTLPEWSDELAKEIGEYESLEDLRTKVREELQTRAEEENRDAYEKQVVDQVVEQSTVQYPPIILERELDGMVEEFDSRLRQRRLTLDDYLKIEGKTKEEFREENKPRAQERLKRALVLGKVVETEKLTVNDQDIEEEINHLSAPWGGERAAEMRRLLSTDQARGSLALDVLTDKALDRLAALARGEDVPLPGTPTEEETQSNETSSPEAETGSAEATTETEMETTSAVTDQ